MDERKRRSLIIFAYLLMAILFIAGAVFITANMFQQQRTFGELRSVRLLLEDHKEAEDALVARGARGLEYVLQEIQQEPEHNRYFRIGRTLEKVAGRFHRPLDMGVRPSAIQHNTEKSSVRKLVKDGWHKIIQYANQAYYHERSPEGTFAEHVVFTPQEKEYLRMFIAIVTRYDKPELEYTDKRLDTGKAVEILGKIHDGKNLTIADARFLDSNFEPMIQRLDRWITGDSMVLLPEERHLMVRAAEQVREMPVTDEADRYLPFALAGLMKLSGETPAQVTRREIREMENVMGSLEGSVPPAASQEDVAVLRKVFESDELKSKIKGWLDYSRGAASEFEGFTEEEKNKILDAADTFFGFYSKARERLSEVAVRLVEDLVSGETRLKRYELLEDPELEAQANVFRIIGTLWRQTEDRVIIINMIDISSSEIEPVRDNMIRGLSLIGEPAVDSLIRAIQRQRIDQALAAATSDRTRDERLRELNEANKRRRIACTRALAEGAPLDIAEDVISEMLDEEDPDIVDEARAAHRRLAERRRES